MDFTKPEVRNSYALRTADSSWREFITALLDPRGLRVADVGCGGGIYSTAWLDLGAELVSGVDSSAQMLRAAQARCDEHPGLVFSLGDAAATGLEPAAYDVVFQRALIHHLPDPVPALREALRLLVPGGRLIIQDRTMDDVRRPGSPEHLRGYFFEVFPELISFEERRRPRREEVTSALEAAGFTQVTEQTLAEKRKSYPDATALQQDLAGRTGRSILHELTDSELTALIGFITDKVAGVEPLDEVDYWSVWSAVKPAG